MGMIFIGHNIGKVHDMMHLIRTGEALDILRLYLEILCIIQCFAPSEGLRSEGLRVHVAEHPLQTLSAQILIIRIIPPASRIRQKNRNFFFHSLYLALDHLPRFQP